MSEEQEKQGKTDDEKRVDHMDKVAATLLALVESPETSDAQKGRLFQQVLAWYKVRGKLVPSDEGGKLKEMTDGLKSKGGRRGRSAGSAPQRAGDGKAIRAIIDSLPSYGGNAVRDPASPERPSGSAPGDDRRVRIDGSGNGAGHDDGAADRVEL